MPQSVKDDLMKITTLGENLDNQQASRPSYFHLQAKEMKLSDETKARQRNSFMRLGLVAQGKNGPVGCGSNKVF